MPSERVPCTKCGASILEITARLNDGLCGTCDRLRAQDETERHKLEQQQLLHRKGISYDIDELLQEENFLLSIGRVLPETDDPRYADLVHVEKVIQSLAEFSVRSGGGFQALCQNEYFRVLDRALQAANEIGPGLLFEGLTELWSILEDHGYPRDPAECEGMPISDDDLESLDEALSELDEKCFHYREGEPSLWASPDYPDKAVAYVRAHIEVFRKRKNK